jgi:type I restriction enzyme S subunit
MISAKPLKDLLLTTKDGDWGFEAPREGLIPYRVIRGADFPDVRYGELTTTPLRFLDESTVSRRTLRHQDILIETAGGNRDRPTGRTLFITEKLLNRYDYPVTCASFSRFLRIDPSEANPEYVFWYLQYLYTIGAMWEYQVQHTGVARFQYTQFADSIKIPLPSFEEQTAIGEILTAFDNKIELNRGMSAKLNILILALFKSWFVDFNPVHEKANGQNPSVIDVETAKFFPSGFEGGIPIGWKFCQFRDLLSTVSNRIGNENAPEYSATIHGLRLRDEKFSKTLSKSKEKNKKIVKNNLVFGLSRQILNFGVMKEDIGSVSPVYEIFDIDTKLYVPELLEMYIRLRMDEHIDILKPAAREGQAIDRNYLLSKKILVPDMKVQKRYQEYCAPVREMITHNEKESRTLASLRDTLLPKLMRGEVRVKDV